MSDSGRPNGGRRQAAHTARGAAAGSSAAGSSAEQPGRWKRRRMRKRARLAAMSRKRRWGRRGAIAGTWLIGLLALVVVVATVGFYQLSKVPGPDDLSFDQVATLTYSNGTTMAKIGSTNRTPVSLKQVPESVRWAVLSAEDRGFYSEHGVSLRGTVRAAVNDIRGGDTQGGSGITQQYVKNAYLNDSRTLSRKLKELAIAVKLDRDYPKDQILEWYLNTIYFGRGAYGIQAAAQTFFGKDVEKLTTSEGALLAGMIQAPSDYDPTTARPYAVMRWRYVLDGMVTTGHLTQAQRTVIQFPSDIKKPGASVLGATGPTALIVNQVKSELSKIGINESQLNTAGLRIKTTVNPAAQNAAQTAINQVYSDLSPQQIQDKLREALVAVNPANGGVIAYYGGSDGTGVDYAQAWRAPGSSFKPFTLAAVLKANLNGVKPAYDISSVVDGSQPANIDGLPPIYNDPGDSSLSYPMPITNAMKVSLNTVFARLADIVGPDNVRKAAYAAGVPTHYTASAYDDAGKQTLVDSDGHTNATIGFGSYRVRPMDQAAAFATLADGGVRHATHFISEVTDAKGKVLYQYKNGGTRAFDPKVANDVTVSMNQVASWSNDALDNGRSSAAKTGTVGLDANEGGNSDAWMVGFTPQVSAAVWTGNDQTSTPVVNKSGGQLYGANMPGQAWKVFMDTYLSATDQPEQPVATQQEIFDGGNQTQAPPPQTSQSSSSAPPSSSSAPSSTAPSSPSTPPTTPTTPRTTPSSPATTTGRTTSGLPLPTGTRRR